jgi:hypothetical protein
VVKVAVKLVDASFAKLADFGMKKDAVGVGADREELADGCIWCDANRLIVLNRYDRRS